jgi:hypothetical protein
MFLKAEPLGVDAPPTKQPLCALEERQHILNISVLRSPHKTSFLSQV